MADGSVTIDVEMDTKLFDAQIEATERKLVDLENVAKHKQELGLSEREVEELGVEIEKTKNKLIALNTQKEKLGQTTGVSNMGNSFRNAIKHAGKLTLAIFGIRSAYLAVRQASSYLASYDKQYAANLEYIKYALTQVIAPVLHWIVSMATKVLQIVGSIINTLFGVNIFANASAKSFQKMKASAGGTAKAAKEIKKQLAGFDEMNILQDQKDSGGGGGAAAPSIDLSKMENAFDFSNFGWKIDDLLGKIKERFMQGFTTLGENIKKALRGLGFTEEFIEMFGIAFEGVKDIITGFIDVVRGIFDIIIGLLTGDAELVKRGFTKLVEGIGQILLGLLELAVGLIGQAISLIKSAIKAWIGWWNEHIYTPIFNFFKDLVTKAAEAIKKVVENVKAKLSEVKAKIGEAITNIVNAVKDRFTYIKIFVFNVLQAIITKFKAVGQKIGDAVGGSFKAVVNAILGAVENILNKPIHAINGMIDKINSLPGVNVGWHLDEFHLPRLAKGGIINMPGRGVMVGNAIAGERGAEGVIPLTDTEAMETLGEAIGRYVTINANITNTMNGRVISRELKKVQNQQDFAFNG